MFSASTITPANRLLCEKGLVKRHSLFQYLGIQVANAEEDVPTANEPRELLLLRHDDAVIRDVFNARHGALDLMNGAVRAAELSRRATSLALIYRLYALGRSQTPVELRRALQSAEMEMVMSAIKRLSLMGQNSVESLVAYCEANAGRDVDLLAHVMDPFQLRYLLSYSSEATRERVGSAALDTLRVACQRSDAAAVKSWFQAIRRTLKNLPLDFPQLIRGVVLELWQAAGGDLATICTELAVVDTQLFSELGWETTRAFCAQLRRVTGPGCEALDGFLTDEDIDSALTISEELRQEDLVAHFRKLASSYNTSSHRDARRSIFARAQLPKAEESPYRASSAPFAVVPSAKKKSIYSSLSVYPFPS
jgi:hypothetical protein